MAFAFLKEGACACPRPARPPLSDQQDADAPHSSRFTVAHTHRTRRRRPRPSAPTRPRAQRRSSSHAQCEARRPSGEWPQTPAHARTAAGRTPARRRRRGGGRACGGGAWLFVAFLFGRVVLFSNGRLGAQRAADRLAVGRAAFSFFVTTPRTLRPSSAIPQGPARTRHTRAHSPLTQRSLKPKPWRLTRRPRPRRPTARRCVFSFLRNCPGTHALWGTLRPSPNAG
jgi:hypothetical protein